MKAVTQTLFRASCAYGVVSAAGGQPRRPKDAGLHGYEVDGGTSHREVLEFVAGGEVIARKVTASGAVECWLRADLIQPTLDHMAASKAGVEFVIAEVAAYAVATRPVPVDQRPVPVLSEGLIHAAMRHSQRIGRFFDMNSKGARERENFSRLLRVARKNNEGVE